MKINMSILDRMIRFFAAVAIGFLFFTDVISGTFGAVLLGIAIVLLLTSFLGVCPLYSLFGFKTCDNKHD